MYYFTYSISVSIQVIVLEVRNFVGHVQGFVFPVVIQSVPLLTESTLLSTAYTLQRPRHRPRHRCSIHNRQKDSRQIYIHTVQ